MNYILRAAMPSDICEMYNISRAAHRLEGYADFIPRNNWERFRNHYRWSKRRRAKYMQKMTGTLNDRHSTVIVAAKGGHAIGYVAAHRDETGTVVVSGLFVRPQYQGQGIGRALLQASYASAPAKTEVKLQVLRKNSKARRLYEREGFRAIGEARKQFFGAHQVTMVKLIH